MAKIHNPEYTKALAERNSAYNSIITLITKAIPWEEWAEWYVNQITEDKDIINDDTEELIAYLIELCNSNGDEAPEFTEEQIAEWERLQIAYNQANTTVQYYAHGCNPFWNYSREDFADMECNAQREGDM